jgi:hypothetical protein
MEKLRFVYLTSPPFSGSTLFSFLVNMHPQVATVGEMTGLIQGADARTYMCSCGQLISSCDFWDRVSRRMETKGYEFSPTAFDTRITLGQSMALRRLLDGSLGSNSLEDMRDRMLTFLPRQHRRLRYLVSRNKALATAILECTGKSVFFDASKNPALIKHLCRDPEVDFRVVHLVRDVRGTSLSRRKNKGETNWEKSIKHWVRFNSAIERQLARLSSDRWLRIRYEEVCESPLTTMTAFFAFCGVEPYDFSRDFQQVEHHIVGNRMRLGAVGQIRLDEKWRSELTKRELDAAARVAGEMHCRYGYQLMQNCDVRGT